MTGIDDILHSKNKRLKMNEKISCNITIQEKCHNRRDEYSAYKRLDILTFAEFSHFLVNSHKE